LWIKEPARINDHIEFLGTHELCFYLIHGDDAMIIDGGMSHATPALEEQLSKLDIDAATVKYAVVTHSHFDHCGAVPYFRQRFPNILILGTEPAREALSKEKIAAYNARVNDEAAQDLGFAGLCQPIADRIKELSIDAVIADGDRIDLGQGIEAQFYQVPGHSKCCVATYVPKYKALFPTDTTPHPVDEWTNLTFPSAQHSFTEYVDSLERLNTFDVEILGLDHHGVLVGEDAQQFLAMGLRRTLDFQARVIARYEETKDLDLVAREMTHEEFQRVQLPFIAEDLLFLITRAMIKRIVGIK
jgi:glyoxylase-like metal-dependent hydrolase (beta-lactamase superfamily II)